MLTPEITPFADHHIDKLKKLRNRLANEFDQITEEEIYLICADLVAVESALVRFKMCMIDEHKMKDRAEKSVRHCRLHHKKD